MKNLLLCLLSCGICSYANAQSSVTLYGLLDVGITYANNTGGHSKLYEDAGVLNGNRWGLRGVEDLGGGLQTIFVLENGFNISTGALGNGGTLFGRQGYVGLSSPTWGTFTLGRRPDLMINLFYYANTGYAGFYAVHALDMDRLSGEQANNSVEYDTPTYRGVSFSAMYGFSDVAGAFAGDSGSARVISFSGKFEGNGPLSLVGTYTDINGTGGSGTQTVAENILGATDIRSYGFGARYTFKDVGQVYSSVTSNRATGEAGGKSTSGVFVDAGVSYPVTPAFFVNPSVTWGRVADARYGQMNLVLDYFLSKRTDVYVGGYFQKSMTAGQGAGLPDVASFVTLNAGDSTTDKQLALRIGIRSKF
jgi:predicted porin